MTRSFLLSLLGVLAFQPGLLADGKLAAGQKIIDFAEKDMAGNPLDTKAYRGKVVLLDFWATWCPPCREEVPHIVKAYEKLHPQGFEIIGISLDSENRAGLEQYLAQNKMTWPQYYDGKHWDTKLSKLYGLESIPHMYLVDEQGIVRHDRATLRGPGTLEKAVEELLAKRAQNPNVKLYEAALKAIAEKNWKLATDSRGALRKAGSEFAAALETEIAKVAARLAEELKQAEELHQAKEYGKAQELVERLLQDYQGIEGLAEAKKLLSQILSRPERKEALARRKVGEEAESAFAKARDLETSGDLPRAVLAYRVVAEKFSGTVAADNAKERLEELDKNPALQNEVRQQKTDKDCKSWLSLAENYARARMKAKAREYLEKILSTYPESSHAETARERLDQLSP